MYGDIGVETTARVASLLEPLSPQRINILGIQKHSPKGAAGKASAGPLATRNRVIPWKLGPCHGSYDKENISSAAEGNAATAAAHEGSSVLSLINSPPPKRLGHVVASPLKHRHPLEDYDPNSQDSGFGNCVPEGEEFRGLENSPSLKAKLSSSGFHIEVARSVKVEEQSRLTHQNEKIEIHRQISITSTSSVEESILSSPLKPLSFSQQSNSSTPGKKGSPLCSPRNLWSISKYRSPLQHSHSSGAESIDDGFLDIFELEKASAESSETPSLPAGINSLLSKPIVRSSEVSTSRIQPQNLTFRRSISLVETTQTPPSSRARLCLFREDLKSSKYEGKENSEEISPAPSGFKRPEPPEDFLGLARSRKRRCMTICQPPDCDSPSLWGSDIAVSSVEKVSTPPVLQRSVSDSEAAIKRALLRSSLEPDLIGDFTRPYSLPLIPGRHQDLKTISSDTLARLIQGEYEDCVDSFAIIDCRYPYEYEGGHIKGAKNLFTHEQILKEFMSNMESNAANKTCKSNGDGDNDAENSEPKEKKDILVFHCEFSSERGPRLSRFLRNSDRDRNKECYPALHYPEIYLLHGGYKEFFDKHSHLCEPCSYLPMADPRYESDLRYCRAKSKSWTGGMGTSGMESSRPPMRGSLKRLGL